MLINFKTNYKNCFVHEFFNFVYFSQIFVLTIYSLKYDVITQGVKQTLKVFLSSAGKSVCSREETPF
jgi:hypothetical protein